MSRILDAVQSIAAIDALDPAAFATAVESELGAPATFAELEAEDAALTAALAQIDAFAGRVMRLCMETALAADSSIGAPTRKVFASTIVAYANQLGVLEQRARDIAARGGARDPDAVARAVIDAASRALGLRASLRDAVVEIISGRARSAAAIADGNARSKKLDEVQRKRWSAWRRELEALADQPGRIIMPLATRLAEWPEQIDESNEPEVTFADMIELD